MQVNIICPTNSSERHIIYSVARREFESCRITDPKPRIIAGRKLTKLTLPPHPQLCLSVDAVQLLRRTDLTATIF